MSSRLNSKQEIKDKQKEIGEAQDALIDAEEEKTKEKAAAKLARLIDQLDDLKARLALYDKSITSAPNRPLYITKHSTYSRTHRLIVGIYSCIQLQ